MNSCAAILGVFLAMSGNAQQGGGIQRFNSGFSLKDIREEKVYKVNFSDNLPDKFLVLCKDNEGESIGVYRKVVTEVCKNGECLPVYLRLYWDITGGYLGFTMEEGEVLTKYDHIPFSQSDYDRLHVLLNDKLSLLGNLSEDDIAVEKKSPVAENQGIDLVTGATKKEIAPYTVGGAAYTTYTLWHTVYGSSRDSVAFLLRGNLRPSFVQKYLRDPIMEKKVWAIRMLDRALLSEPELTSELVRVYSEGGSGIKDAVLNSVFAQLPNLRHDELIVEIFKASGLTHKRRILNQLSEYSAYFVSALAEIACLLPAEAPPVALLAINLIRRENLSKPEIITCLKILVKHEDKQVSNSAEACLTHWKNNN